MVAGPFAHRHDLRALMDHLGVGRHPGGRLDVRQDDARLRPRVLESG
jgi:hypothetical protein